MEIILNHSSMIPIYEQLMEQIRGKIISGELLPDQGLPSVRTLAGKLRISALTVKKAYDRLEAEGLVVTIHGKGTYVAASNLQLVMEERKRLAEESFSQAIDKAKAAGLTMEEIRTLVQILLEED